jgi:hypothetical protein
VPLRHTEPPSGLLASTGQDATVWPFKAASHPGLIYTLGMSVALAALVIAVGSLTWNMVSTLYSWKFSRPDIEITPIRVLSGKLNYLNVEVRNKGGSPVGVTRVIVNYEFERWWQRKYLPGRKWLRPKASSSGLGPIRGPSGKEDADLFCPCTVQAYHSETWQFDRISLLRGWANYPWHTKRLRIDVWLATGKQVRRKIDAELHPGEADFILNKEKYMVSPDEPDQPELPFENNSPPE